jgi:predicted nucleic-acid-binding Zn-ribbon protein
MENVYVVIGIGSTPVVYVFDNQDAANMCKDSLECSYDQILIFNDVEVREAFSRFVCPRCGSTEFKAEWIQRFDVSGAYDPQRDTFDIYMTCSHTNVDDSEPEDIEISCDSCGYGMNDYELEELIFESL